MAQVLGLDIPETMKAWVLGDPDELKPVEKPVPRPGPGEVLVRIDAVAICATDLEIISHGPPALIDGELPFNKNFTPGHEDMGTIAALGPTVDEYAVGDRIAVEIHAGCGRCPRCRMGMYTSCLNYGANFGDFPKGHRANGYTTDGAFTQYAVNHVNTLVRVPDDMSDEVATLIVTAGTAMYGLDVLGGLVAGNSLVVTGAGPIGLLGVAVGKALGAGPVILTDIVDDRLETGARLGADHVINAAREPAVEAVRRANGGLGADFRPGMLGRAQRGERGHRHGQPRRTNLSGCLLCAAGVRGYQSDRHEQHLHFRYTGRGPKCRQAGGRAHGTAEIRCFARTHAYVPTKRTAASPQALPGESRRRHQGCRQEPGMVNGTAFTAHHSRRT